MFLLTVGGHLLPNAPQFGSGAYGPIARGTAPVLQPNAAEESSPKANDIISPGQRQCIGYALFEHLASDQQASDDQSVSECIDGLNLHSPAKRNRSSQRQPSVSLFCAWCVWVERGQIRF